MLPTILKILVSYDYNRPVMGNQNENGSFVHILLYIHLTFLKEENKSFRYLLYEQIMFYNNECRITSLEDMNEGAAQK